MGRQRRRRIKERKVIRSLTPCSVCFGIYPPQAYTISRCHECVCVPALSICETCFLRYITDACSSGTSNPIRCPQSECSSVLSFDIVRNALQESGNTHLWTEYHDRCNWKGTTAEWMKRFSAPCPYCRCPIEKNGGCNNVLCTQCNTRFSWMSARMMQPITRKSPDEPVGKCRMLKYVFLFLQIITLLALVIFFLSGPTSTLSLLSKLDDFIADLYVRLTSIYA